MLAESGPQAFAEKGPPHNSVESEARHEMDCQIKGVVSGCVIAEERIVQR